MGASSAGSSISPRSTAATCSSVAPAARATHERAEREWRAARDELRAVDEAGTLPRELREQVGELLRDEGPAQPHRRWRPAPS